MVRYPDGRADLYVLPTARCHVRHARQERFDARYPSLHYAVAEVLPVQYSAAFTNLALNPEVSSILKMYKRTLYPGRGDAGEPQLLPGSTLRC